MTLPYTPEVLVAGSGKMARNIALHLLERGLGVGMVSRDTDRLAELEAWIARRSRRFPGRAWFTSPERAPRAGILIESIEEQCVAKQALFTLLADRAEHLVLSNSSSFLPSQLHARAAGLHFFYPVAETAMAEAILPEGYADRAALEAFADRIGVRLIIEDERSAFMAVRILLPLQVAAFRCLQAGVAPHKVDAGSVSGLLPTGVLTLMDAIGLDVLAAATAQFTSRMTPEEACEAMPLVEGLATLVALGKRGQKNRDGLLLGAPLPWAPTGLPLMECLGGLVAEACRDALRDGLLAANDLDRVLTEIWGATCRLEDAVPLARNGQPAPATPEDAEK